MKPEDQNTEYKQGWREEYLKWVCGFANAGALPENWTVKKLLGKHPSRPHNPTIAGCVYLTGKIETWGRGIRKVFDECRAYGCPPPVYEVSPGEPGDIQVCLHAAPDAIVPPGETPRPRAKMGRAGVAAKSPAKQGARPRPTKRPAPEATNEALNEALNEAINEAIKTSPGISAPQLMRLIGKSRATVGRCLAALIREGKIEHRGSRKTGGYYCATPQRDGGKA